FAGRYEHPAYGKFEVRVDGHALVPSFHSIGGLELRHRTDEAWDLWIDDVEAAVPAVFRTGLDGDVAGIAIELEPLVDPIEFTRVHDVSLTEEQARRVAGTYTMGPLSLEVEVSPEAELTARIPGHG